MNPAHSYLAKTEVVKQLGYFPAFLIPAINSSLIFRSLVQQTLTAYVDNPLPDLFKEKLFVVLSRYFGASYFTICHSCTLLSLGVSPTEIFALKQVVFPQSEAEIAADLTLLKSRWHSGKDLHNHLVQNSLLRCSCFVFLSSAQVDKCNTILKELLGTGYYNHLVILLGYIKLCHNWLANNPEISHQKDRRSQLYLGSLLLSDNRLAEFLQSNVQLEISKQNKIARRAFSVEQKYLLESEERDRKKVLTNVQIDNKPIEESQDSSFFIPQYKELLGNSCVPVNNDLSKQTKRENLTKYLTSLSFPLMIRGQDEKVLYLNHSWVKSTGYSKADIPTLEIWKQKAGVKPCNIQQLGTELSQTANCNFSSQLSKVTAQIQNMLREITQSLSNLAEEINKLEVENSMAQIVKNRVTFTTSYGKKRLWESHTVPFIFGKNREKLTISIAQDITEIITKQTKKFEITNTLDLLMEEANSGKWSWDLINDKIEICRQGLSILGLDDFDGSYQSFLGSIHPEARDSINLSLIEVIKSDKSTIKDTTARPKGLASVSREVSTSEQNSMASKSNGNPLGLSDVNLQYPIVKTSYAISWIRQTCNVRYNSAREVIKLSGIIMNITPPEASLRQAKQVQQDKQFNVTQSYNELAKIINLLPSYVFVSHVHDETISLINLKLSNCLNLQNPENICGKTISECFDAEYARQILWHQQQVLTYGKETHVQEEVNLSDGIHYFDTTISPLRDDRGEIYALLHTSNDIPDLAATKEALSQRTLQLEAANKELESFSYSVSHDLQAPLRVINGFSQVLWDNYQPDLDDRGKHYLQRIQANSEKMSDLIDALLQLSRVTRSQMKSVEVNLSKIAKNIIEELQQENPERNVEFVTKEDAIAIGDPQLLRIVLDNLLNNAWKYTSKRSQGKIEFDIITSENNKQIFYVKDNGAGFDLEYADKLFTAFKRLHSQADFPGTGIGLATVQRIIYRHGGKVWADGECDRGATIYFSLEAF